jgi:membrane-associated phospholipid phosphatase
MRGWNAVDRLVAGYATFVAVLAVVCAVPQALSLAAAHAVLVAGMWWLPPRGASWESPRPGDSRGLSRARVIARFLRYTYPALLLTPFFEEVALTVNAVRPGHPYWFEPYLIGADRALFGGTPAARLSAGGNAALDELLHGFYLSYYFLITAGIVLAWRGPTRGRPTPGTGFHPVFTTMMLGFVLSFVWYPFLPARGPWEHPELVVGLRPLEGWLFTPAIELIIAGAAVSGGCFPSAHVSGTWALTFGLYRYQPRAARWFAVLAVGLSLACVYTRYHHGLDVLAGVSVAAIAAWLVRPRMH